MENSNNIFDKWVTSSLTLANAGELVANVITEIAGNDISNSINGSKITSSLVKSIAYDRIYKVLDNKGI